VAHIDIHFRTKSERTYAPKALGTHRTQLDVSVTVRQAWNMASQEMEPYRGSGVPDVPDAYMPPWYQAPEITTRPEWTELRPPYREESDIERRWSTVMMVPRAMALGFLWITYTWYRTALLLVTVALIWIVFVAR